MPIRRVTFNLPRIATALAAAALLIPAARARTFAQPATSPSTAPYRYRSLQELSHDEIERYMEGGIHARDAQRVEAKQITIPSRVPDDFWKRQPQWAALAIAEFNRTEEHRQKHRLAWKEGAGPPPGSLSIVFTKASDRCREADLHYFLRADPADSYLACARVDRRRSYFVGMLSPPGFDLRYHALEPETAFHVAHVLWWLRRLESKAIPPPNALGWMPGRQRISSTADGYSGFRFVPDDGRDGFKAAGYSWSAPLSQRWMDAFEDETLVNFAELLIARALPGRLGGAWGTVRILDLHAVPERPSDAQAIGRERHRLQELASRLLARFVADPRRLPDPLTGVAARAAGSLGDREVVSHLREILARLPEPDKPPRTVDVIWEEIHRLYRVDNEAGPDEAPAARQQRQGLRSALFEELHETQLGFRATAARDGLRESVRFALRQIDAAEDPAALQDWAASRQDGSFWALAQLRSKDTGRCADALEGWLMAGPTDTALGALTILTDLAPARALAWAQARPAGAADGLALRAFDIRDKAGAFEGESHRAESLLAIMRNARIDALQQTLAILHLVPIDRPLRHPDRAVDEALANFLAPRPPDASLDGPVATAYQALALRGRVEYFDRMKERLDTFRRGSDHQDALAALAHLAQQGGRDYEARLIPVLQPHLRRTALDVNDVVRCVWAAGLRELAPDIERIATASPDEVEGAPPFMPGADAGLAADVSARTHLARRVLALWNEPDLATRVKLLILFGLNECVYTKPEMGWRTRREIEALDGALSGPQRQSIRDFLAWHVRRHDPSSSDARLSYPPANAFFTWVRARFP